MRKLAPRHLRGVNARRTIHITCALFSRSGEVVATYNDEVRHQVQVISVSVMPQPPCSAPATTLNVVGTKGTKPLLCRLSCSRSQRAVCQEYVRLTLHLGYQGPDAINQQSFLTRRIYTCSPRRRPRPSPQHSRQMAP